MSEILAACGLVALAGGICFATQLAAWKVILGFAEEVGRIRRLLFGFAAVGTVFVIGVSGLIQLAQGKFHPVELPVTGGACVGFFTISYRALAMTIRRQEKSDG